MKNSIGGSLEYIYDAAGNKLAKKLNGAFVNFYCGSVYTGSKAVEYVMHSQGMARPNGANWEYFTEKSMMVLKYLVIQAKIMNRE